MNTTFVLDIIKKLLCICVFGFSCLSNAQDISIKRAPFLKENLDIIKLFDLDKDEKIEYNKSLYWETNKSKYTFLAVSYKKSQGCRFVFIDIGRNHLISDGAFNFENCTFIKEPELMDINHDGKTDFKVWMKLPHHVGSDVMVLHSLDFIYNPNKEMFCESNSKIPCNATSSN